ncbi:hypothetical protein EYF80_020223 [Liparis tanakae]|uniref:Uncharacterized protein n=1 Tax=Liparis tanakae TaxID=230148 RepID=A0A4Z2HV81_9TELE|nr:hypothetical protein EYF80_020223 [Liparis tanakae]
MKRHDNQNLIETAGLKPNHAKTKRNKENQEGPEVDTELEESLKMEEGSPLLICASHFSGDTQVQQNPAFFAGPEPSSVSLPPADRFSLQRRGGDVCFQTTPLHFLFPGGSFLIEELWWFPPILKVFLELLAASEIFRSFGESVLGFDNIQLDVWRKFILLLPSDWKVGNLSGRLQGPDEDLVSPRLSCGSVLRRRELPVSVGFLDYNNELEKSPDDNAAGSLRGATSSS